MQSRVYSDISVSVAPSPFTAQRTHHVFAPGVTVEEIVARVQPDPALRRHAHVFLAGEALPRGNWRRIRPRGGATLCIRMAPMGSGGGKDPLRTVLSLAIMAASPALAPAIAGALGPLGSASFLGVSAGRIIAGGVGLLGRLALNALAPPARGRFSSRTKESPTLFLQGARNRALPFGRVPRVLGRHRMTPPMGALPHTETVGNDQYMRLLFVWGYGPLEITDLRIGETPLSEFEDVEVETRQGFPDDPPITLYSNSVLQNDMQVPLTSAGGYVVRTTEADADEISVDITFPQGMFRLGESGKKRTASVNIEVQYSPAGAEEWSAAATGYKEIAAQAVSVPKPAAYHYGNRTYHVARIDKVVLDPASGAASVLRGAAFRIGLDAGSPQAPATPPGMIPLARVERRSSDDNIVPSARIRDERAPALSDGRIESSQDFAVAPAASPNTLDVAAGGLQYPGLLVTAAQSSALRRSVSFRVPAGQYDVRVRRVTPDSGDDDVFDEAWWTALRTVRYAYPVNMPGVAMTALRIRATDQLSGVLDRFNGVAHAILPDWTGSEWVEQVTSNPASIYRHILQGGGNARPLPDGRVDLARLREWHEDCAAAGREFNAVIDYDVSVREILHDVAAAGRASPALVDGKWSIVEDRPQSVPVQHFTPRNTWGFRGEKSFDDTPHALRVRFINRDKGWMQDEVLVFDDGYTAGTATKYEALDLPGVTSAAQAWKDGRYHIATARLRPETYSFCADVEHIVCTRGDLVRFTHDVPLFGLASARVKALAVEDGNVAAATLDAEVAMEAGKSYAARFRLSDGTSLLKLLSTVAGVSDTVVFAAPFPQDEGLAAGDLALLGESGQESVELVVKSIVPQGDLCARITCVDAAPAVHAADTAGIPAFSPQITVPLEMRRPPAPVVAGVLSGEGALIRTAQGAQVPAIALTLAPPDYPVRLDLDTRIRHPGETEWRPAQFSAGGGQVTVLGVDAGARYDIRLVYRNAGGFSSAPALVSNHLVGGTPPAPPQVEGFAANVVAGTAYLGWEPVENPSFSHYRIRFNGATSGATWAGSFDAIGRVSRDASSLAVPALDGTWMIRAVGFDGREGPVAAAVSRTGGERGHVTVDTVEEDGIFGLTMHGDSEGVDYDGTPAVVLDGGQEGVYVFYNHADLFDVYTCLLTARMSVQGVYLDDKVDDWGDTDAVEDWDGAQDPAAWRVQLQVRVTNDHPLGTPAWGPWQDFVTGEYTGRAFQFRVKMQSFVEGVSPAITSLSVDVSMPRWSQTDSGVVSHAGDTDFGEGTDVEYAREFYDYDGLSITPLDMEAGDYYVINYRDYIGFNISFFDQTDSRVTRTFDYTAQGIGRKAE